MEEINNLREKINEIDSKIIELLRERFNVAKDIGKHKKSNGIPIFDVKREKEVIERIVEKSKQQGIKDLEELKSIYNQIMAACRSIQEKN